MTYRSELFLKNYAKIKKVITFVTIYVYKSKNTMK